MSNFYNFNDEQDTEMPEFNAENMVDAEEFGFDGFDFEDSKITMVDENTGEEFEFIIADDFDFDGEVYCVLITTDEEPEAVFVKVTEMEDGTEGFMSLDEDEFDKVSAEYDRLCAEDFEDDDDYEDEDEE